MKKIPTIAIGLCAVLIFGTAQSSRVPKFGPPPRDISNCRYAAADARHRFIVAGVMGGDTLSDLQLGDANGSSTIVRVKIEAGSGPLMIFLHSESPVIWDFEGAVEQVVAPTRDGKQRMASRGLPERVIKFGWLSVGDPAALDETTRGQEQR